MPRPEAERIAKRLYQLAENPDTATDVKALSGRTGEYRLRVGDWRIIYRIVRDKLQIQIVKIGPRGDVYKH